MVLELANLWTRAGEQAAFEEAVHRGVRTAIAPAHGFRGYELRRSIEVPEHYALLLQWDTLEDHTVGFRGSSAHAEWRAIVGPFFERAPSVEHYVKIGDSAAS